MSGPTVEIGPYVTGEIPIPLEYQYLDSSGAPLNLTGYTVKFQRGERGITAPFINSVTVDAQLTDAVNGKVTYVWTVADFATPGPYVGMFFAGNGTNRYASWLITWTTCLSVDAAPSI